MQRCKVGRKKAFFFAFESNPYAIVRAVFAGQLFAF
jgi:hypothetical protein